MSQTATCPRCQSPLATDAPEGLCPACLLAGGLASVPSPAAGFVATTPWTDEKRAAAIADLAPHFPQLEIIELLGQGGMGAVYKARQKHLDRLIALKVIPPEAATDPAFAERFAREARALARLNHPNIVTVYDFGQSDGVYFLLMEFVDGLNLRQTMQGGNLAPPEALAIVPHICDALQYAHDQGIVHRDVKPENVLLDKTGRVKIADFGLAKLLTQSPLDYTLTHSMQVMGTPRYMAPEQIEHPTDVDHRADIYSLGVMFYEMLTGELPMGRFAPPSQKVQIDIRIDEIVLRSLEKEPGKRYQRASEVKTELETVKSTPSGHFPLAHKQPVFTPAHPSNTIQEAPLSNLPRGTLGRILLIAIFVVASLLVMSVGIMIGLLPFVLMLPKSGSFGFFGAGFGCFIGGLGSLLGTLNTYRQMSGKPDWMETEYRTWLDRIMLVFLLVGIAMLLFGWMSSSNVSSADDVRIGTGLMVLGSIIVFQGVLFLAYRAAFGSHGEAKPRGPEESSQEDLEPADVRRQVAVPGMGLMIAGFLGIGFCLLSVLVAIMAYNSTATHKEINRHSMETASLDIAPLLAQAAAPQPMASMPLWIIVVPLVVCTVQIPSSILLILGGSKMRRLETYGLAVTAGIVALLPTGPVWIISLPVGIWALIVLANGDVQDAFRKKKRHGRNLRGEDEASPKAALPPHGPVDRLIVVNVQQQLFWPGLGLAGGGGMGLVAVLFNCLAAASIPWWLPPPGDAMISMGATIIALLIGLQILFSLIIIASGLKMMRVENYGLALTGACLALLPLSLAAIITMPLGIWALVALSSRETREAFRQNAAR